MRSAPKKHSNDAMTLIPDAWRPRSMEVSAVAIRSYLPSIGDRTQSAMPIFKVSTADFTEI